MPTTTDARVRVVLVNYRSIEDVEARLASPALADAEVVVVDNGSDPDRVRELCERHDAIPVLLPENRGFAAGVNAGWSVARARRPMPLLLLNPDAEVTRAGLDALLTALPERTGVAPLLIDSGGQLQAGIAGGRVSVRSTARYFLRLPLPGKGLFLTDAQARAGGTVAWLCMACLLLQPDALDQYGAVPDDELVYAEDIAWGTAATARGALFALCPEVMVRHDHGSSGESARWVGALERLLRRRLGAARGSVAIVIVRWGLALRRGARTKRSSQT